MRRPRRGLGWRSRVPAVRLAGSRGLGIWGRRFWERGCLGDRLWIAGDRGLAACRGPSRGGR